MLGRRDLIRAGALGVLLGSTGGLVQACGDANDPRSRSGVPPVTPTGSGQGGIQLLAADVRRSAGDPALLPPVEAGLGTFAARLYAAVAGADPTGNVVISPYSVAVALSMVLAGARGATATQLQAALGAEALGERWHHGMDTLTAYVDGLAGTTKRSDGSRATIGLTTANSLFGQRGVAWEHAFLDLLAREYGAGMRAVDFADTDRVRALINAWVADHTDDRITDLIQPGALPRDARLALVDAISLTAPWEKPFTKSLTSQADFHLADGSTVRTPMMHERSAPVSLVDGDGWQAARIPYAGSTLAMTVVLPDAGRLADVEKALAAGGLDKALGSGRSTTAALSLPRWSTRSAVSLVETLSSLGITDAFLDSADLSGMTRQEALKIGAVLHQGYIKVDEDGTEAAAATAAVAVPLSARLDPDTFVADRPFLYVLHDTAHGTPLFLGRVTDPTR